MLGRIVLIALPLALSACAEVSYSLVAASSLSRMWFDWPREPAKSAAPPLPATPVYCYRTLADEVCYAQPLTAVGDGARLIGHVGPEPSVGAGMGAVANVP